MNRILAVFAVVICAFFTCVAEAEAKRVLPADADAFLEIESQAYYLGHNLHGDLARRTVYSVNYQISGGLIPGGS